MVLGNLCPVKTAGESGCAVSGVSGNIWLLLPTKGVCCTAWLTAFLLEQIFLASVAFVSLVNERLTSHLSLSLPVAS